MSKNFRKTPTVILEKIRNINGDLIIGTIVSITEEDFGNPFYSDFNIKIIDGQLLYENEIVPCASKGIYSKKNINGYKIKYPERPRVSKTYYAGERPIFGDYSRGTFSLYISRMVIDYEIVPPREISLILELLEQKVVNDKVYYLFKISTSQVLSRNTPNFQEELFFNLNILQENIGSVDVFSTTSTREDYLNSLQLNWEIFPPGERDEDLQRITQGLRGLNRQRLEEINDRYLFLKNLKPLNFILGRSGILRYFGARFSDNLVVFENTRYGNAIYILFENWEELSQLSRLKIQSRPPNQFIRIPHRGDWKATVKAIIDAKR